MLIFGKIHVYNMKIFGGEKFIGKTDSWRYKCAILHKKSNYFRSIFGKMLSLRHQKSIIYAHILPKTQERNRFAAEYFVLGGHLPIFYKVFFSPADVQHTHLQRIDVRYNAFGRCTGHSLFHSPKTV